MYDFRCTQSDSNFFVLMGLALWIIANTSSLMLYYHTNWKLRVLHIFSYLDRFVTTTSRWAVEDPGICSEYFAALQLKLKRVEQKSTLWRWRNQILNIEPRLQKKWTWAFLSSYCEPFVSHGFRAVINISWVGLIMYDKEITCQFPKF